MSTMNMETPYEGSNIINKGLVLAGVCYVNLATHTTTSYLL